MNEPENRKAGLPGPPSGVPVDEVLFGLPDLPRVRHLAEGRARRLGLREDAVGDLVIAVNEVATNAVTHGADSARMRTWVEGASLVVEIHDEGAWLPGPAPGAVGGMGLWVARRLAADLVLRAGSGGSTVLMRFPVS
ncbi:MAG: ATP-binding protein [Nonomuraea sp.]|nr:ATP-binding protein [Nonomuraea sp.]